VKGAKTFDSGKTLVEKFVRNHETTAAVFVQPTYPPWAGII